MGKELQNISTMAQKMIIFLIARARASVDVFFWLKALMEKGDAHILGTDRCSIIHVEYTTRVFFQVFSRWGRVKVNFSRG